MRHYASNSPQAIARLLALSMLIDGAAEEIEYQLLERSGVLHELGLDRAQIDAVVQSIYEDMDLGTSMARTLDQRLSDADLSQLVGEVTESRYQQALLMTMMRIVVANDELSAGEARLIREALVQWNASESLATRRFPASAVQARPGALLC